MSHLEIKHPVVSVQWLHKNLNAENVIILDGTIDKGSGTITDQIPMSRYFDIKHKFSNTSDPFPNAFPSEAQFQTEARNLGINSDSVIVVYDDKGIYSSARVWWMFKAFGHDRVAVLNGGFPAWVKAGYPVEPMRPYSGPKGNFEAQFQPDTMVFFDAMKTISADRTARILDARSAARFNAEVAEPRKGLRSGHIPNAVSLPYTALMEEGLLMDKEALEKRFNTIADKDEKLVFSCGSGITACILALAAEISGYKNCAVYDGSWTEWGTLVEA